MRLLPLLMLLCCAASARAELPSFEAFFKGVSECGLDLGHGAAREVLGARAPVMLSLPNVGTLRGLLVTAFYFEPGDGGQGDDYGLLFVAPVDVVAHTFPELAARGNVNGYLRQLRRLSEKSADPRSRAKTLLLCHAGTGT